MLAIVLTSLALAERRRMKEILSPRLKHLVDNWELRILVSLSLAIQVVLIILGNRRKHISHYWIRIVVWCAYLSADAVAIYALGITPGELQPTGVDAGSINPTSELRAFWAPFLLMHLGGPDTITANSLEDNELWLRHCLSLVIQTVATFYILFLSWTGSYLSWLYVVILICGLIKYSERVGVLWAASSEQFRDSTPERHQMIFQKLEEQKLKESEGQELWNHDVDPILMPRGSDLSHKELYKRSQAEILVARRLIDIFRPAFADLPLSEDDRESSKKALKDTYCNSVLNILSIELGFIYDLLFTKVMVFQTLWGYASRVLSLSLTGIALIVFTVFSNRASYDNIDKCVTFALLGVGFSLELCALLGHLFSDKVTCLLIKNDRFLFLLNIINRLQPLYKRRRWSDKIGQFSLLSYSLKEKHLRCHRILGFLHIDDKMEKFFYKDSLNVSNDIKYDVVQHVIGLSTMYDGLKSFWDEKWGKDAQQKKQLESLKWSIELEFDMCILIWHIATDICFHGSSKDGTKEEDDRNKRVSLDLSRYMLYLLVMYPFILPAGIGRIKFHDMYAVVATFFEQHKSTINGMPTDPNENPKQKCCPKKPRLRITDACNLLLDQVNTQLTLTVSSADKSKFVLFHGCKLASQLNEIQRDLRWMLVRDIWMAMLVLAALKCKASYHLQQLKRGGELLTHVWLLLIHFGLTDHFRKPHAPEIAELNVE